MRGVLVAVAVGPGIGVRGRCSGASPIGRRFLPIQEAAQRLRTHPAARNGAPTPCCMKSNERNFLSLNSHELVRSSWPLRSNDGASDPPISRRFLVGATMLFPAGSAGARLEGRRAKDSRPSMLISTMHSAIVFPTHPPPPNYENAKMSALAPILRKKTASEISAHFFSFCHEYIFLARSIPPFDASSISIRTNGHQRVARAVRSARNLNDMSHQR